MNKEKSIIFSAPMVQAIIEGRKTQTRRVIKPQPLTCEQAYNAYHCPDSCGLQEGDACIEIIEAHQKIFPGDILWVRETWAEYSSGGYCYKADGQDDPNQWKPPIQMPRAAARIFLRVTDVRVERVQEISTEDAIAEGCEGVPCDHMGRYACEDCMNTGWLEPPQVGFSELWNSLNAKRGYGLDTNPWVWVYEFERIDKHEKDD